MTSFSRSVNKSLFLIVVISLITITLRWALREFPDDHPVEEFYEEALEEFLEDLLQNQIDINIDMSPLTPEECRAQKSAKQALAKH